MTTQQLNIDATQAIKSLEQVNQQIVKVNESEQKVGDAGKKATKEIADGVEKAKNKWTELNSKIEVFQKGIEGGIGFLTKFKDVVLEMEGFQTQATALKLMSKEGQNLNNVLNNSVEITKGVVSQYDLLAVTNELMIKGFNLSEESLTKLIDVSAIYSSITGEQVSSVMQKLATASQRERDSVFEKMGVYIDTEVVLEKYAGTVGTTADRLDEATKSAVLLENATTQLKAKFDETGLSATSLESPITNTFKKAETSIKDAQNVMVGFAASLYVKLIGAFESVFEKYDEFSERLSALFSDGFDGVDRVAEKWANRRFIAIQEQANKEIAIKKRAEITMTENFILYSEQQKAYGIKNNEIIYNNYVKFLSDLEKAQGKAYHFSSKLFDIDPSKDKRNLASEMFFTSKEVDEYSKKSIEKYQKYWAELSREQEKIINNKTKKLEQQYKAKQDLAIRQSKFNDSLFETGIEVDDNFFESSAQTKREQLMQEQMQDLESKASENRINLKKNEHEILLEQEREYQEKVKSYLIDAANNIYSGLINSREDFLQETIALSMQRAGAEILNDGLIGLWQGGRWAMSPYPTMAAQGVATIGYSLAEIGAGLALGYAGAFAMPSTGSKTSESKNKETAARDRMQNFDTQKKEAVVTYLYPDERTAIQQLSKINKKF